ncbi:MAG: 6-phosphofructokinase, partial [Candidatus Omnitrophota bacterium]
ALAGGAENVLVPELKFDIHEICQDIVEGNIRGKITWMVIVAEGASSAADVAKQVMDITGLETRIVVLGHIQRGGTPTARDRIVATRLGSEAVTQLLAGSRGKAVGIIADEISVVDLEYAVQKKALKMDAMYHLVKVLT